ncbi:MAG: DUF2480 family protein [Cyclobacteriaceae bacterium]|jgi:hypothetical protein|nr:hypothetical protein [Cytophagales bacterium]HNP75853.1 DUF2480 family protein [Cyclobacteriaceae bacterium]HQQ82950.1 DUF2480 family protein [Cyclobacteriaceae bacterium]
MENSENEIVNRVANSSLVTFNLEDHFPDQPIAEIDLATLLYEGIILREKDLREFIKNHDWSAYTHQHVAITCSVDAVIPTWAFILVGIAVQPFALTVVYGNREVLMANLYRQVLDRIDWEQYRDQKVVIKGCNDKGIPASAYVDAATRLRPVAASLMFGEPCSTVPLFKKSK